jgi:hypothetical protein
MSDPSGENAIAKRDRLTIPPRQVGDLFVKFRTGLGPNRRLVAFVHFHRRKTSLVPPPPGLVYLGPCGDPERSPVEPTGQGVGVVYRAGLSGHHQKRGLKCVLRVVRMAPNFGPAKRHGAVTAAPDREFAPSAQRVSCDL